jgi:uncharacterized protein YggE
MTIQKITVFSAVLLLVAAVCSTSYGQYGMPSGAGVVQGSGNHVVKRMPDTVRVYLQVSAKGKTLEEALGNLKKRTDAIREQVPKLGGKADTVKFSPPDKTDSSQQQQMIETLRRQMGNERVPKGLATPTSVTVNSMLTADWPLTADSAEKLLMEADKLQKKIVDADLAGVKAAEKEMSAEEREMAEEMQTMVRDRFGGNDNMPKPGTPNLSYVARLSEADRDAAMAEAFKKARASAERLAKAAGIRLGSLAHVTGMSNNSQSNTRAMIMQAYRQQYNPYQSYDYSESMADSTEHPDESSSNSPGEVSFNFNVSVGYAADK